MHPDAFQNWLQEMRGIGYRSDAEIARLLDKDPHTIVEWKQRGTDVRTAYACAALLQGLEPYEAS